MRALEALSLSLLLLAAGLAGCLGEDRPQANDTASPQAGAEGGDPPAAFAPGDQAPAFTPCEHPWPCQDGTEWPPDLEGPFEMLAPEHITVESFDGTLLDGWVWRPDLPEGVGAPVLLEATPYLGTCSYQSMTRVGLSCKGSAGSPGRMEESERYPELIEQGYAVAIVSVRGTGGSGGCYDMWGLDEQRDQVETVAWLADQPWSNGRVAMTGISYMGTTPWGAAIHQAPALKAITVAGVVTDAYLGPASPQGAIADGYDRFRAGTAAANSYQAPWSGAEDTLVPYASVAPERLCPEGLETLTATYRAEASDDRAPAYWEERRLVTAFPEVQAAVLVLHGFQDDNFHRYQEDTIWAALPGAPKAFVLGQWDHTLTFEDQMEAYDRGEGWLDITRDWYDFWLKGLGDPPQRLGTVDYQVDGGGWQQDTAWPPTAAREEALYLGAGALAPLPAGEPGVLDLTPVEDESVDCADDPPISLNGGAVALHYLTEPAAEDVVLAGNPMALLEVEADQPGGLFAAALFEAAPGWTCQAGGELDLLSHARADLRFHQGNLVGEDFPVGTPTSVRVDFYNLAHKLPEGHRLLLVLRSGDDLAGQDHPTRLELAKASHLVLPVLEGTLGGQAPTAVYPPRPFLPRAR